MRSPRRRAPSAEADPQAAAFGAASAWFGAATGSVSPVAGGATHRTYRVVADRTEYFLRRYRDADPRAVDREHRLIRHVALAGIPAPPPVPLTGGATQLPAGGALWALFEAAQGVQLPFDSLTAEHARGAGQALARLHRSSQDMPHAGFDAWTLGWDGARWAERLAGIRDAIAARPCDPDTDAWAGKRLDAQIAWMSDPACAHRYSPAFPGQVIHGDYQLGNLFFAGTEVCAVIDWDGARIMPRAFEIARACFFLCQMERELTWAFLDGYTSVVRLDRGELEDGARAWGCFADHHVWPVEELYVKGNAAAARFVWRRPFAPFLDEWRAVGF